MFTLYNTKSKKIEELKPINPPTVTLYSCGPTVYDYTHVGHLRTFINNDILKRALIYNGFQVKHVMNITDVGHLTGDDDSGEDKMEKGAKKQSKTVWEIAKFYSDYFLSSINKVNIIKPDYLIKVTDHIKDMIDLIAILTKKGFTYETDEAIYFDISKFKSYGKLSQQKITDKNIAVRQEVNIDPNKKHPEDFALWLKLVGRFKNHVMRWSSPWGEGFPGWHIECSAMSMKYFGETIDIHTGGVDHIPVHHENEIAQSEAATGKTFVKLWFHSNMLLVNGEKMSKSLENFYTIDDVINHHMTPLSLRYLYLQTHYRQQANYTWQALESAQTAYQKLIDFMASVTAADRIKPISLSKTGQTYLTTFKQYISDDLAIPQALSILWRIIKSDLSNQEKYHLIIRMDEVFGLGLDEIEKEKIPQQIFDLATQRQQARNQNDFTKADELRKQIESMNYQIKDTPDGFKLTKSVNL